MRTTDHTLMEQLRITPMEIARRKEYLGFSEKDAKLLESMRQDITDNIEDIVETFYKNILPFDEMDQIIGDAQTLARLKNNQHHYIISLFDGQYDEEYVHSRLRVGMVHKRIGLDPKYYVAAVHILNTILKDTVSEKKPDASDSYKKKRLAIEKILMFDLSLTVDTYINGLIAELQRSKGDLKKYAESLEKTIVKRTQSLEDLARHDGLTSLINQHTFYKELKRELSRANRLNHSTTLIYFDLDGFKKLNDSKGHKVGDELLVTVADSMRKVVRDNEISARYGGDEFCIILSDGNLEDGTIVSKRLCDEIKKNTSGTGISVSIGIAVSTPENHMDTNSLVKAADKAMYAAKKEKGFAIKIADHN